MSAHKRPLVLHPFLFAVFPALSLYALNLTETSFGQALRALLLCAAGAGVLLAFFRLVGRTWQRAGLAASLALVLFFTFGHAYRIIHATLPPGSPLMRANLLLAIWATALILGVWWLLRKQKHTLELTRIANVMAAAALLTGSFPLASYTFHNQQSGAQALKQPVGLELQPGPGWGGQKPDIYYIILDGYGRADTLQEFYDVDNTPFLDGLRRRGFTIASGSNANYWKTPLSLSSSLNFHYLDELIDLHPESTDPRPLNTLVHDSAARRFLQSLGYRMVAFGTAFEFSDIQDADVYYPPQVPLNPFEVNLLAGTMAIFWVDWAMPVYHRHEVLTQFRQLAEVPNLAGPKFVFAHLVIPHPPFVFDKNGSPVAPMGGSDGNAYTGGVAHYVRGYSQQVQYANRLVEGTVDAILKNSPTPPIIILQGDHGPGAYLNWQNVDLTCIRERFPILNAYFLPGEDGSSVARDITPVNSLRMVFNMYFDTHLPMEENHNYAVHWVRPYEFYEVTDRLDWCPMVKAK